MLGVGCDIFYALLKKVNYKSFISEIISEYNVTSQEFEKDLKVFINILIDENILYFESNKKHEIMNGSLKGNENITQVQKYYLNNKLPYKVFLELTYKCNLRCDHCYLGDETIINLSCISYERIKVVIDELSQLGLVELVITGGEAMLYEKLIDLLNYANTKNILVTLLTNGTMLNDIKIDQIIKTGIHDIRISIYGLDSYHDSFVHRKGSFSKSVNALSLIRKKAGIGIASCIITRGNVTQLKELEQNLNSKGIPLSYSPLIFPTIYGNKEPMDLRLKNSELEKCIEDFNIRIGGNICTAGISRFRITPDGDVNPCEMLRHVYLGNIYKETFNAILSGNARKDWLEKYNEPFSQMCLNCNKNKYCIGCMGIAYLETGDIKGVSKFACDIANIQYVLYSLKGVDTND